MKDGKATENKPTCSDKAEPKPVPDDKKDDDKPMMGCEKDGWMPPMTCPGEEKWVKESMKCDNGGKPTCSDKAEPKPVPELEVCAKDAKPCKDEYKVEQGWCTKGDLKERATCKPPFEACPTNKGDKTKATTCDDKFTLKEGKCVDDSNAENMKAPRCEDKSEPKKPDDKKDDDDKKDHDMMKGPVCPKNKEPNTPPGTCKEGFKVENRCSDEANTKPTCKMPPPKEGEAPKDGEKPKEGEAPKDGEKPKEGEGEKEKEGAKEPPKRRMLNELELCKEDVKPCKGEAMVVPMCMKEGSPAAKPTCEDGSEPKEMDKDDDDKKDMDDKPKMGCADNEWKPPATCKDGETFKEGACMKGDVKTENKPTCPDGKAPAEKPPLKECEQDKKPCEEGWTFDDGWCSKGDDKKEGTCKPPKKDDDDKDGLKECAKDVKPCKEGFKFDEGMCTKEGAEKEKATCKPPKPEGEKPEGCADKSDPVCHDGSKPFCSKTMDKLEECEGPKRYCKTKADENKLEKVKCADGVNYPHFKEDDDKKDDDKKDDDKEEEKPKTEAEKKEEAEKEEKKKEVKKAAEDLVLALKAFAEPVKPETEEKFKEAHAEWKKTFDQFKEQAKKRKEATAAQNKANEAAVAEIESAFTPVVATANKAASEASNALREAMGAAPLVLDVATVKEAAAALAKWICKDKAGSVTDVEKDMWTCEAPKQRRLAAGDCHENVWTNPDPATETTSGKAV